MLKALVIGKVQLFEEYFSEYVLKSFNYFDVSGENPESIRINSKHTLENAMEKAIEQVNKKLYDTELKSRDIKNIIKLALVFEGKEVLIRES